MCQRGQDRLLLAFIIDFYLWTLKTFTSGVLLCKVLFFLVLRSGETVLDSCLGALYLVLKILIVLVEAMFGESWSWATLVLKYKEDAKVENVNYPIYTRGMCTCNVKWLCAANLFQYSYLSVLTLDQKGHSHKWEAPCHLIDNFILHYQQRSLRFAWLAKFNNVCHPWLTMISDDNHRPYFHILC